MNSNGDRNTQTSLDILINELLVDDELCESFFRDPQGTLRFDSEWPLPLTESELQALRAPSYRVLEKVAEQLGQQFGAA